MISSVLCYVRSNGAYDLFEVGSNDIPPLGALLDPSAQQIVDVTRNASTVLVTFDTGNTIELPYERCVIMYSDQCKCLGVDDFIKMVQG